MSICDIAERGICHYCNDQKMPEAALSAALPMTFMLHISRGTQIQSCCLQEFLLLCNTSLNALIRETLAAEHISKLRNYFYSMQLLRGRSVFKTTLERFCTSVFYQTVSFELAVDLPKTSKPKLQSIGLAWLASPYFKMIDDL